MYLANSFVQHTEHNSLYREGSKIMAYPGDGWQGGQEAQWAGPRAGLRGPEAEAGLAVEDLAWLQKTPEADSGAGLWDLYQLYKGCKG